VFLGLFAWSGVGLQLRRLPTLEGFAGGRLLGIRVFRDFFCEYGILIRVSFFQEPCENFLLVTAAFSFLPLKSHRVFLFGAMFVKFLFPGCDD
jgi:hypothetical protein